MTERYHAAKLQQKRIELAEQNAADIEYIAMMTDVELDAKLEEVTENAE